MTKDEIEKGCKLCASASDYSNCNDCPDYVNCVSAAAYNLIIEQEKDINQLKTECALLDDELRGARQNTINVLNELKEKFKGYEAWYYNGTEEGYHDLEEEIDEFIKELINNAKNKG